MEMGALHAAWRMLSFPPVWSPGSCENSHICFTPTCQNSSFIGTIKLGIVTSAANFPDASGATHTVWYTGSLISSKVCASSDLGFSTRNPINAPDCCPCAISVANKITKPTSIARQNLMDPLHSRLNQKQNCTKGASMRPASEPPCCKSHGLLNDRAPVCLGGRTLLHSCTLILLQCFALFCPRHPSCKLLL